MQVFDSLTCALAVIIAALLGAAAVQLNHLNVFYFLPTLLAILWSATTPLTHWLPQVSCCYADEVRASSFIGNCSVTTCQGQNSIFKVVATMAQMQLGTSAYFYRKRYLTAVNLGPVCNADGFGCSPLLNPPAAVTHAVSYLVKPEQHRFALCCPAQAFIKLVYIVAVVPMTCGDMALLSSQCYDSQSRQHTPDHLDAADNQHAVNR